MARGKRPAATGEQWRQWQRWGVCDAGTADSCGGARQTVPRLQQMAAHRAQLHHCQGVQAVDVQGGQRDEAHAQLRPQQVEWGPTALAMGRGGLLGVACGPRTPEVAAPRIAQVVARVRTLPLCLMDGWQAYPAARLQVGGVGSRRRRRGHVGRTPQPRLVAPQDLCYAQGVQVRDQTAPGVAVRRRVVCGGPRRFGQQWRRRQRGETIQTALMARWDGTLRGLVAPLRRRTRCVSGIATRRSRTYWLRIFFRDFSPSI
jgi:hypothetical protein